MPHSPALVLPDAELDIHRDRRRAIAVYVGGVLLLLVVIASLMFDQYRRDTRIAQERTVARADLVAEWVTSTFAASEALLASVATRIEGNEAPGELGDWLAALGDELPFLDKISVLDSQGRVMASSSRAYPPGYALGGLPYHRDLLQAPAGERIITPLFWSHFVEEFRVVHAQRLAGGGIVSAELELSAFSHALD
ncbi:MAG TPA: hypothetical protein VKY70_11420, partial [Pseudomonas sp.]|nr:hypothetical protein [Pseudomonas sp.]